MSSLLYKTLLLVILSVLPIDLTKAQTLSLLFAGDAMQHQAQLDNAKQIDGSYYYDDNFLFVKDEISSADLAFINFETTLGGYPYSGYPTFCSPDEYAKSLKKCGFNIFLTANNHCLDKGSSGLFRTIRVLDSLDIKHTGTYADNFERNSKYPLIIRKGDIKIGILNYTYGTNGIKSKQGAIVDYIDTTTIKSDIALCKLKGSDIIIANIHWGDEYQLIQNYHQKQLSEWLHKNEVRIVIGSHPHVVQPIEIKEDSIGNILGITVYSLGNFISNMRTKMTKGAIMFRLNLVKENNSIKIENPRYTKIFTQRPEIVKGSPYCVIPCDSSTYNDSKLPIKLREDMKIFNKEVDLLFKQYNKGRIKEYFFSKIGSKSCTKQK